MAAQLQRSGVKVLLAVDQTSQVVEELGRLLPELRQVVIAHGSIRAETLPSHCLRARPQRLLCVWGLADVELYRRETKKSVNCKAVGSLRNAGYQRLRKSSPTSANGEILLISQFSGRERVGAPPATKREAILYGLETALRRYCMERSLPLVIALRPPVSAPHAPSHADAERIYFQDRFSNVNISFTNPDSQYSSYFASDGSGVTVGVPTGTVTESFARGNRVLMYCQSGETGDNYRFPLEGPWLLTEPTYEEFAERLDALRSTQREKWAAEWQSEREYMVANAESDRPITMVREMLERAIRGESL
jgi:hypothetical protein